MDALEYGARRLGTTTTTTDGQRGSVAGRSGATTTIQRAASRAATDVNLSLMLGADGRYETALRRGGRHEAGERSVHRGASVSSSLETGEIGNLGQRDVSDARCAHAHGWPDRRRLLASSGSTGGAKSVGRRADGGSLPKTLNGSRRKDPCSQTVQRYRSEAPLGCASLVWQAVRLWARCHLPAI